MSNKLTLQIILEFSDDVPEEDHQYLAENVAESINHTINTKGLVSDDAFYVTERITISGETIETIQGNV